MNTPEEDRLAELSKSLDRVIRWQAELDARIRELESAQVASPVPLPQPAFPAPNPVAHVPPPIPFPRQPLPMPPAPVAAQASPAPPPIPQKPGLETRFGLHWINRIAVITLLLGAAFLFKYGVDNDWIGPAARVALGVAAGLGALFAGNLLTKRNQRVFAQGITGLGLALLYLAFYAAAALYHVIDPGIAFGLMAGTTIAAGAIALKDDAQAIAVLGLVGGYITPIALSTGEDYPWILLTYLFLLNLGALAIARLRPWRVLEPLAFCATFAMFTAWVAMHGGKDNRSVATVFALAFYAEFAAAETRAVWWGAQFLASLGLMLLWERPAAFLPYEFLVGAGGLVVGQWRNWREGSPWALVCYWLPMWLWIFVSNSTSRDADGSAAFLAAGFILFLAWTAGWILLGKRKALAGDLFVLATNPVAYFATSYVLLNPAHHQWMSLFAALLGGLHLGVSRLLWKNSPRQDPSKEEWEEFPGLMAAGVALAFVTLAIPLQFAGFSITIAWASEGLAIVWVWSRFKTFGSAAVASFVLTLALLRLFSLDLLLYKNGHEYQALVNPRFLAFLVCAICLWLAAWLVKTGPGAAVPYVAGHVVLLIALGLETVGAVERNWPEPDQWSVITVAVSILIASYAVFLVTVGVVARGAIHRILGLILAGIVILKLYLVDVWVLGRGFRIAAFLGLGGLLLAMSYLYSRFRPSVQKLWKN